MESEAPALNVALLVDTAVEPVDQIRRLDFKCGADSQKCPYRDRPARFDLLPVTCGKSVADHVFLGVSPGFA
jgi:hypothetical protein